MGIYRFAGRAIVGGARMGARAGNQMGRSIDDANRVRSQSRAARRGILGPGDPQPPGNVGDYYDYSGVADARDARSLAGGAYRIGRLIKPSAKRAWLPNSQADGLGLPFQVLERHAVVVGPAGCGKTHNVMVPWIAQALRDGHTVVAVDVKGDLADQVEMNAASTGPFDCPVSVWDYSNAARSRHWNWVKALDGDESIDAAVQSILGREDTNSTADPFFYRRDYAVFRGLLRLVKGSFDQSFTGGQLLALLRNQQTVEQLLRQDPSAPGVRDLDSVIGLGPGEYERAISGVSTALAAIDVPEVEAVTRRSQLDLADLTRRPQLLVVGAPMQGGRLAEATSSLLFGQLMQRLYRGFRSPGHHVFFVIDEAARLTKRLNFEEILTVARSAGVSVCLALQDVTQLNDEAERSAILSNCAAFIAFSGVSPTTAKTLGDRLGDRPVAMGSMNTTNQGWGRSTSFSQSMGQAPVLGAREIMSPPFGPYSATAHINAPAQAITSKPVVVSFA